MGFQGDVAGIGLGELLQGLARGGREGVLTLHAANLDATLGLAGGQMHLLPDPDEDPEIWRKRCERAWVKDPNQRIDALRMSEIAFAARMETMFSLLDSEGVHFRFEPGALPYQMGEGAAPAEPEAQLGRAETGTRIEVRTPVLCHPISVEYLLLEYARLCDECQGHGDAMRMPLHWVPRLLVPQPATAELERFWIECDGVSNVLEIADRMGWPLRQGKSTLADLAMKGYLRFSDARELLVLAQHEIAQNHFARAASRLSGWCQVSPPGPPPSEDIELLLQEWSRGKLPVVLASMEPRSARLLLRRIELVDWSAKDSILRWRELRKHHRHDMLSELHLVQWQLRSEDESDAPSINDLLKLARNFQDAQKPLRAAVILRAAAARMPESTSVRLEIGTRLIAVGLPEDGAHWVLESCRTMVNAGHADKALGPLRTLLDADPANREARQLMSLARTKSAAGRRTRRTLVLFAAMLGVVGLAALVKVRIDQDYDRRLDEVSAHSDDPLRALGLLDAGFASDESARVAELRHTLQQRIESARSEVRNTWLAHYKEVQQECNLGDSRQGLQRALALEEPPEIEGYQDNWPSAGELMEGIAARLEQELAQIPADSIHVTSPDSANTLPEEAKLLQLAEELEAIVAKSEPTFATNQFVVRLHSLRTRIQDNIGKRTEQIEHLQHEANIDRQSMLLAAARMHEQAGDHERAVETYRRLFEVPGSELIRQPLAKEVAEAERQLDALKRAEERSLAGDHAGAEAALKEVTVDVSRYPLPWRVESVPTGARVTFADGGTRETPFEISSAIGEPLDLTFELQGYERQRVRVDRPTKMRVVLSRMPEIWWQSKSRIHAPPVPVGGKEGRHIVTNRAGEIALLEADGSVAWDARLESLGGIARTPVFLPGRPDALLMLTEEGVAWIVDAEAGRVEGPWSMGAPPVAGLTPTESGVLAAFNDGRQARWFDRLKPEVRGASETGFTADPLPLDSFGSDAGMSVLRRGAGYGTTLRPPWGDWSVDVLDTYFQVQSDGQPERAFYVRREGEWSYVAWEAPDARSPAGRLWLSDDRGLRCFEP